MVRDHVLVDAQLIVLLLFALRATRRSCVLDWGRFEYYFRVHFDCTAQLKQHRKAQSRRLHQNKTHLVERAVVRANIVYFSLHRVRRMQIFRLLLVGHVACSEIARAHIKTRGERKHKQTNWQILDFMIIIICVVLGWLSMRDATIHWINIQFICMRLCRRVRDAFCTLNSAAFTSQKYICTE